jgi:hypothetical protein
MVARRTGDAPSTVLGASVDPEIGMYIDEPVQAPDGRRYLVRAYRNGASGPGGRPLAGTWLITLRRWRVDVVPVPRGWDPVTWTATTRTYSKAAQLCDRLVQLVGAGEWHPGRGDPPPAARSP